MLAASLLAALLSEALAGFPPTDASWTLYSQDPVIQATEAWEQNCVCEPEMIWFPKEQQFRAWYRGGWDDQSVGVATSPDGVSWTKYAGNPVYGAGGSGVEARKDGAQPFVFHDASADGDEAFWLFTTTFVKGPGARANVATSRDGYAWTPRNASIPLPTTGTMFGNRVAWRQASGSWSMLQEVMIQGDVWAIHLYTSDDGLHWVLGNDGAALGSLQVAAGGMYGGPSFASVDGVLTPQSASGQYHLWYHAAEQAGNLPTNVYHATSDDLIQWTISPASSPILRHVGSGFAYDQVADPSPVVVGDRAFLFFDGDNNVNATASIGLATATADDIRKYLV